MFTVELTQGANWREPVEVVDHRPVETDSIAFAIAEARFWLTQSQRIEPHRRATHYRIISEEGELVAGGPP